MFRRILMEEPASCLCPVVALQSSCMVQSKKPKAVWEEVRLQDNRVRREPTTTEKAVGHASHSSTTTARVDYELGSTLSDSRCAIWILAVHLRASLLAERVIVLCCETRWYITDQACKHVSLACYENIVVLLGLKLCQSIILHCVISDHTMLHCTVLCYIVLCCVTLYYVTLYYVTLHYIILYLYYMI